MLRDIKNFLLKTYKKYSLAIIIIFILLVFLIVAPIITNFVMFMKAPEALTPKEGISKDSVWVGFLGAILGGLASGTLTYIGVWKTIKSQKEEMLESRRAKRRTFLIVSEIYNVKIDFSNMTKKLKGKVFKTENYNFYKNEGSREEKFNFCIIENFTEESVVNCSIKTVITLEGNEEELSNELFMPIIHPDDQLCILLDPHPHKEYRFTKIILIYQTMENEKIKLERYFKKENGGYSVKDVYSLMRGKDEAKVLLELRGSSNEWEFVERN
ncbi:hypothetical protein ACS4JF_26355 [Bacillus thuringiensis]|uniref:hypothetical protein n=1 Tax=Bacillus thuringiensis TaxID=1428 RepID=UPI001FAE256F|nr:hypothetical protein [Bacillus thuringiensis]MDM8361545.1 hypothetical protein [Bacillus thuringiensis]